MDSEDPLYISTVSFADTLSFARVVGSLGESMVAGEAGRRSDDYTTGQSGDSEPTRVEDEEGTESPIVFKEGEPSPAIELEFR